MLPKLILATIEAMKVFKLQFYGCGCVKRADSLLRNIPLMCLCLLQTLSTRFLKS